MTRYIFDNDNEVIVHDNDTATYIGTIGNKIRSVFHALIAQGKISCSNEALKMLIEQTAIPIFSKKMGIVVLTETR